MSVQKLTVRVSVRFAWWARALVWASCRVGNLGAKGVAFAVRHGVRSEVR